ncbi:hypothetical protein [Lysinibacillus sphaericus]|nr:hypothetical protein [Lysinibacillus sphaericus]MBE5085653.1 hypothetical protein [Bacillus thuringiensis]AMO35309.1 hypothetical protein AR327_22730 [Lysinibacillus sphaericus]AMR93088.1 hypothetical protein A1T07_23055 [Lysinibacillus sphaericus]MBG9710727.1 hypothetical protein [Lysinibacillus sphaericus]MBG9730364.1 hypothetical protein [Lysinibacillus sphaericus]
MSSQSIIRKILLIISIVFYNLILVGCNDEQSMGSKELIFLEKTKDYGYPLFIFESIVDKKYYSIEVTNWEYDNTIFEDGEKIEVDARTAKELDVIDRGLFSLFFNFAQTTDLEVYINDDWQPLFEMTDYSKSN